nr:MAG TPA: hypothetical protein [Caudoviricetes sp.]
MRVVSDEIRQATRFYGNALGCGLAMVRACDRSRNFARVWLDLHDLAAASL